jgi:hypothetical protein
LVSRRHDLLNVNTSETSGNALPEVFRFDHDIFRRRPPGHQRRHLSIIDSSWERAVNWIVSAIRAG